MRAYHNNISNVALDVHQFLLPLSAQEAKYKFYNHHTPVGGRSSGMDLQAQSLAQ